MNRFGQVNFSRLRSPVTIGVIAGVIVLLIVWWFAWMTPEASKLTTVNQQASQLSATTQQLNIQIAALERESATVQKELPFLAKFATAVPPTADPGGLTNAFFALSIKTKVTLLSVTDNTVSPPAAAGALGTVPVAVAISGTHANVFAFLQGIYTMARLVIINSVGLSPSGGVGGPNILATHDGQVYSASISGTAFTTLSATAG